MEDGGGEAERQQQLRQQQRGSQVQQEEAALEGAAGEPAGRETPQEEVQAVEGAGMRGGPLPYGWRRAHSLPPSLSHHSGMNNLAGLADWRHTRSQLHGGQLRCQQPRQCNLLSQQ